MSVKSVQACVYRGAGVTSLSKRSNSFNSILLVHKETEKEEKEEK